MPVIRIYGHSTIILKKKDPSMLRIALQSKGRLNEESMALLHEAGIKLEWGKRLLLVPAKNFPI